jgi:hypothetical protein
MFPQDPIANYQHKKAKSVKALKRGEGGEERLRTGLERYSRRVRVLQINDERKWSRREIGRKAKRKAGAGE